MSGYGRLRAVARYALVTLALGSVLALPAAASEKGGGPSPKLLEQLSGAVASTWLVNHPDQSPYDRAAVAPGPLTQVPPGQIIGPGATSDFQLFLGPQY